MVDRKATAFTEAVILVTDFIPFIKIGDTVNFREAVGDLLDLYSARTAILTNKTFDANGVGNSITNIENADLASGVFSNITGLGAQSQALDMNTQILQFVDANQSIQNIASNLIYDVATGQVHLWRVNNVTKMQLSATALDLQSNALLTTGAVRITGGTMRIPLSATPTMAVDGDFAIDTTVTDFSHGLLKFFDGEEVGIVSMPIAQFTSPTDGNVVSYNATNDEFELVAGGGVTPQVVHKTNIFEANISTSQFASIISEHPDATESRADIILDFAFTITRMRMNVTENAKASAQTYSFRDDAVDAASISVTASGTGKFDSGALSVAVASGSLVNFNWQWTVAGNFNARIVMVETEPT